MNGPAAIRRQATGRRFPAQAHGFTLIEALATLVMVGIVLPVALRGVMLAAEAGSLAERRDRAVQLAESKLMELIVSGEWQTGTTSGDFIGEPVGGSDAQSQQDLTLTEGEEQGVVGYTWDLTVEDWNDVSLQLLVMHVRWEQRNREREITLSTIVRSEDE